MWMIDALVVLVPTPVLSSELAVATGMKDTQPSEHSYRRQRNEQASAVVLMSPVTVALHSEGC